MFNTEKFDKKIKKSEARAKMIISGVILQFVVFLCITIGLSIYAIRSCDRWGKEASTFIEERDNREECLKLSKTPEEFKKCKKM